MVKVEIEDVKNYIIKRAADDGIVSGWNGFTKFIQTIFAELRAREASKK